MDVDIQLHWVGSEIKPCLFSRLPSAAWQAWEACHLSIGSWFEANVDGGMKPQSYIYILVATLVNFGRSAQCRWNLKILKFDAISHDFHLGLGQAVNGQMSWSILAQGMPESSRSTCLSGCLEVPCRNWKWNCQLGFVWICCNIFSWIIPKRKTRPVDQQVPYGPLHDGEQLRCDLMKIWDPPRPPNFLPAYLPMYLPIYPIYPAICISTSTSILIYLYLCLSVYLFWSIFI